MTSREVKQENFNENVKKSALNRIDISELPENLPDFTDKSANRDKILAEWLAGWIESGLAQGKLRAKDLLPTKGELSKLAGVSMGTVQTAIRTLEDQGYVASKQRIGTFICEKEAVSAVRKHFSKRDCTVETIKKYIVNGGYQLGDDLPSSRSLSKEIGCAPNTTRLALEYLAKSGTIQSKMTKGNKAGWILNMMPENINGNNNINTENLVDQIERDLKDLITGNCKVGDRLMSHYELANALNVSIKTVHDAMKRLVEQGILQSRRGRYGTYILRMPSEKQVMTGKESEIFAPAVDAGLYNYEKVESYLRDFIKNNFKPGDKLPAMSQFAEELKVSGNTIRKALQNLSEQGIVRFSRGRYGGTFLIKRPERDAKGQPPALSWISVNIERSPVYSKKH